VYVTNKKVKVPAVYFIITSMADGGMVHGADSSFFSLAQSEKHISTSISTCGTSVFRLMTY
jgi:hypothetical protein